MQFYGENVWDIKSKYPGISKEVGLPELAVQWRIRQFMPVLRQAQISGPSSLEKMQLNHSLPGSYVSFTPDVSLASRHDIKEFGSAALYVLSNCTLAP